MQKSIIALLLLPVFSLTASYENIYCLDSNDAAIVAAEDELAQYIENKGCTEEDSDCSSLDSEEMSRLTGNLMTAILNSPANIKARNDAKPWQIKECLENQNAPIENPALEIGLIPESEKELIDLILANKDYCTERITGGKIYLDPDKLITFPGLNFLRLDEYYSMIRLPKLHADENGCYLLML